MIRPMILAAAICGLFLAAARAVEPTSSDAARAAYASAAALQNREAWDLAADEWQALIAAHPQDPLTAKARYYLAICRIKDGKWPEAEKSLREVVGGKADDATLALARWELARGGFQAAQAKPSLEAFAAAAAALADFLATAPQHPQAAEAEYLRGEALWQAGKRDESLAAWQAFLRDRADSPRLPDVLYALGVGLAEKGDASGAGATFDRFARDHATHSLAGDVTAWRADLAAKAGKLDEARPLFEKLFAGGGAASLGAAHRLAALELAAKRPQAALDLATKAIDAAKSIPGAAPATLAALALDRADALWELPGRRAEATAAYAAVARTWPDATTTAAAATAMTVAGLLDQEKPGDALAQADAFLKTADAALARHPTGGVKEAVLDIRAARADALLALGKSADAAKAYRDLLAAAPAAWPRREQAALQLVRALRDAGDRSAALAAAEQFVKDFPKPTAGDIAWYRLGQLRQDAGRFDDAIAAFTRCRELAPRGGRAAWSLLAAGWCHEARGRLPEAIRSWTECVDAHAGSPAASAALLARGDARQRGGDFAGGLADATAFLEATGVDPKKLDASAIAEARLLQGLCLAGDKKHAQAAAAFAKLLAEQPKFAAADRVLFELGAAQALAGKPADATATFTDLVARFPRSSHAADAWLEIGESRWAQANYPAAADAYRQAITAAGTAAARAALVEQARHKLGWTFVMRKDHAAAAEAFTAQLDAAPQGRLAADAAAMLGESLFALDRPADAAKALKAAVADPAKLSSADMRAAAFIRAAECAARASDWKESLALAERLLAAEPASPRAAEARYAAAWAKQNLGRLDDALAGYRDVADSGRTEIAARGRLMEGEVLFEQGRHKDAIKSFFKVAYGFGERQAPASYHPWQAQATYEAARCFEVLGKPDQARGLYAELTDRYPDSEHVPAARKRLAALPAAPPSPGGSP